MLYIINNNWGVNFNGFYFFDHVIVDEENLMIIRDMFYLMFNS